MFPVLAHRLVVGLRRRRRLYYSLLEAELIRFVHWVRADTGRRLLLLF